MKKKKIILLIILAILLLYAVSVIYKLNVLNKIEKANLISIQKSNIYYYSQTKDMSTEYWKKDDIIKVNTKQLVGVGDLTFWKDLSTNEGLCLYNMSKQYSPNAQGINTSIQSSSFSGKNAPKLFEALLPFFIISSKNYDNTKCYVLKMGSEEEYINKETGLLVYNKSKDHELKITYKFDSVTNEDVQKPNLEGYTLQ